jgi:hypothetical protein
VTSPVACSPDGASFAYGTYEGTAIVARTPTEVIERASVLRVYNGNMLLRQTGMPSAHYHFEVTTNLVTWRELCVLTANSSGFCEFLDTNCHGFSPKYYRSWRAP